MKTRTLLLTLLAALIFGAAVPDSALARRSRKAKHGLLDEALESASTALVKAPEDREVCFSPDEPCEAKLVKFVDTAQKSIDTAIYDVNLDQLVHHLLDKARSIPVRIIVDRKQAKGTHSLVKTLVKAGADVRYGHQRGIMHNKFMIVDGRMVETGSFNYTHHAARANNENQIYLADPKVVARYERRFETIWREATPLKVR